MIHKNWHPDLLRIRRHAPPGASYWHCQVFGRRLERSLGEAETRLFATLASIVISQMHMMHINRERCREVNTQSAPQFT